MIKNIVFDMGNVLMLFEPMNTCKAATNDPALQQELYMAVFCSPEWVFSDLGFVPLEERIVRVQRRLNRPVLNDAIDYCFRHWLDHFVTPIPGMADLVGTLKSRGYGIYLCSNASQEMADHHDCIVGIQHFDGLFFSAPVRLMKPQRQMYETFFAQFDLVPEECFFIDDLPMNIAGSQACGMDGHCFEDLDVGHLRQVLAQRGIL